MSPNRNKLREKVLLFEIGLINMFIKSLFVLVENLLIRPGRSLYNGLCILLSVFGFSLNLWNGRHLISRFCLGPLRTSHSFFCHLNTSICRHNETYNTPSLCAFYYGHFCR